MSALSVDKEKKYLRDQTEVEAMKHDQSVLFGVFLSSCSVSDVIRTYFGWEYTSK